MKIIKRLLSSLLLIGILFSLMTECAFADYASNAYLSSQDMVDSTNNPYTGSDIVAGNWTDTSGNCHKNSLKFWVIHGPGYFDTESIKYKLEPNYNTLTGTVSAADNCDKGSRMWVNIYLDDNLVYESNMITRNSGEENFRIDISNASYVTIECATSTSSSGYCIVDARLTTEDVRNYAVDPADDNNSAEKTAADWYLKAANAGNATAMNNIGNMYFNGTGVSQNYTEAMKWYQKAADGGDTDAMNSIGYMYDKGLGVNQNYYTAMKWYLKAANAGNVTAMGNVGTMYYNGTGVNQNYTEAMKWYQKAADAGNSDAMNMIGYMVEHGLG